MTKKNIDVNKEVENLNKIPYGVLKVGLEEHYLTEVMVHVNIHLVWVASFCLIYLVVFIVLFFVTTVN